MIYDKLRQVEVATHSDAVARKSEVNTFFLAGPFIKIGEPAEHPENSESSSHILRYYLNLVLAGPHVTIYLGEDRELREVGLKHYGSQNNATIFERHYIQNHLDGVIMLPSSPGSFCEIGDWATTNTTCEKMFVIVDKSHEHKNNYINEGVLKLARNNGAEIHYMNYQDKDAIRNACMDFIERRGQRKRVKVLYGQL